MRVDKHARTRKLLQRFGLRFCDLSKVQRWIVDDLQSVEYVRLGKRDSYELDNVGHAHHVRASRYESHDCYRFRARNGLTFVWDATQRIIIPSEYEKLFK